MSEAEHWSRSGTRLASRGDTTKNGWFIVHSDIYRFLNFSTSFSLRFFSYSVYRSNGLYLSLLHFFIFFFSFANYGFGQFEYFLVTRFSSYSWLNYQFIDGSGYPSAHNLVIVVKVFHLIHNRLIDFSKINFI